MFLLKTYVMVDFLNKTDQIYCDQYCSCSGQLDQNLFKHHKNLRSFKGQNACALKANTPPPPCTHLADPPPPIAACVLYQWPQVPFYRGWSLLNQVLLVIFLKLWLRLFQGVMNPKIWALTATRTTSLPHPLTTITTRRPFHESPGRPGRPSPTLSSNLWRSHSSDRSTSASRIGKNWRSNWI